MLFLQKYGRTKERNLGLYAPLLLLPHVMSLHVSRRVNVITFPEWYAHHLASKHPNQAKTWLQFAESHCDIETRNASFRKSIPSSILPPVLELLSI